jgi:mono/diheme cytochrome c family protein
MAAESARAGRSWKRILLWVIGGAVAVFLLIQLVPYGRTSHTNPPASNPFQWTDRQAEAVARESCYDCHSNETEWWWATSIAPFSWLTQRDVDEGRARLNFSDWNGMPVATIREVVEEGEMPPFQYTLIHPGARLTDAERQTLVAGYTAGAAATSGASGGGEPAATPSASPTTETTVDALAVIDQQCGRCHSADTARSYRAGSEAEAQALLDDMVGRGAQITEEERQVLVRYFTQ